MNTTRTLTHLTALSALVAAAFMLQARPVHAEPKAQATALATSLATSLATAPSIVELPRVVMIVRRAQPMQIVELPRVVIVVRRTDDVTRVVQAKSAAKGV